MKRKDHKSLNPSREDSDALFKCRCRLIDKYIQVEEYSTMAVTIDKKLSKIVEVLKAEFSPVRLFLFGSRASGKTHIDSDYDFVLVVPDKTISRQRSMAKARSLLHEKCQVSADVFFYSQREFNSWKDELNSIPETAISTGMEFDLF